MQEQIRMAATEASQRWEVTPEEAEAAIRDQLPEPQTYMSDRETVVNILDWFPQFFRAYKQDPTAALPMRVGYWKPQEESTPHDGHIIAEEENGQPIGPACKVGYRSSPYITPEPSADEIPLLTCIECISGARHSNRAIGNHRTFKLLDKRWKALRATPAP